LTREVTCVHSYEGHPIRPRLKHTLGNINSTLERYYVLRGTFRRLNKKIQADAQQVHRRSAT